MPQANSLYNLLNSSMNLMKRISKNTRCNLLNHGQRSRKFMYIIIVLKMTQLHIFSANEPRQENKEFFIS